MKLSELMLAVVEAKNGLDEAERNRSKHGGADCTYWKGVYETACENLDTAFRLDSSGGTSYSGENNRSVQLRIGGEQVSETTFDIKDGPEYEG